MVVVEDLPRQVKGIRIVCWPDQAYPGMTAPQPSKTTSRLIKRLQSGEFKLEASYLDVLRLDSRFAGITDIKLALTDVSISEPSDADLIACIENRTPECVTAVGWRAGRGQLVYTVVQVLTANVEYTVYSKHQVGTAVGLSADVLKGLAPRLAADHVDEATQTIRGERMNIGVYLDVLRFHEQPGAIEPLVLVSHEMTPAARRALNREHCVVLEP